MTRAKTVIFLLMSCLLSLPLKGQVIDSTLSDSAAIKNHHRILDSKVYQITHVGAPLILAGALLYQKDHAFRSIRNSYIPRFRFHYDDYLQYSPGLVMLGLKSFGVEGRSSWGRMITSDLFSAGIMAMTVNAIKYTVKKERPDKSGNNSFPSGHSATAFMFATMLHKEYGTTRSPLYSVLGYSLATGTAISRQLNNKHWLSDVLTGAGIGIVSTELGYYLADLIFKNKGIIRAPRKWKSEFESDSYSFLGIQMGYNLIDQETNLPESITIKGSGGATASLTSAWFFRPHWGFGGKFTVSQTPTQIASEKYFKAHPGSKDFIGSFESESANNLSLVGGLHYTTRLIPGLYAGGSAMAGIRWVNSHEANIRYKNEETTSPLIDFDSYVMPKLDVSAYIMHITGENLGVKLFVNYNTSVGNANYTYYTPQANTNLIPQTGRSKIIMHNFNIGAEISAIFWK